MMLATFHRTNPCASCMHRRVTGTGDQTSASPQIIDPREERRALERRVDEEMNKSPFVSEAVVMGFTEENIRKAFLRCHHPFHFRALKYVLFAT